MTSPLAQLIYDHTGPHSERQFCRHWCARHADRFRLIHLHRVGDPLVRYRPLDVWVPLSHPLAAWQCALPNFGEPLRMIVRTVGRRHPGMACIDIGANVGDSCARIRRQVPGPILAVEGTPAWYAILERNAPRLGDVTPLRVYLGNRDTWLGARVEVGPATARVVLEATGPTVEVRRLDSVLRDYPRFQSAKFLKIDTDGFDIPVIRGAAALLERSRPAVFFEYDPLTHAGGDDPLSVFPWLRSLGYDRVSVFTNLGDWRASTTTADSAGLEAMSLEMASRNRAWFADICVWHADNADEADEVDEAGRSRQRTG
jgi:FkbM family methyltransferase